MVSRARTPQRMMSPDLISRVPKSPANRPQPYQAPKPSVPLLIALIENQEWSQAIQRLRQCPNEASILVPYGSKNNNNNNNDSSQQAQGPGMVGEEQQGNMALHEACKNQPPVELISLLLEVHEAAVQTKGQWGYLPLHIACMAGASLDVVARLIMTYPSATRTKEDREGQLPLHLAAKWGAEEDVLMALLTVHPKASATRDAAGRTPTDLASQLASNHTREDAMRALRRAPMLIAVSKAAMNKLAYESDAKVREVVEVYQDRMAQVKEKFEEYKTQALALENQLRKDLWEEKERNTQLEEHVSALQQSLEEREQEMEENQAIIDKIQVLMSGTPRRQTRKSPVVLAPTNTSSSEREVSKPAAATKNSPAAPTRSSRKEQQASSMPPQSNSHAYKEIVPEDTSAGIEVVVDDPRAARQEQHRLAKIAFKEWAASNPPAELPQHLKRPSQSDMEEQRDAPPETEEDYNQQHHLEYHQQQQQQQYQQQSVETEVKQTGPSPKSAAVATVKEWFSSESQEFEESHPELFNRSVQQQQQQQQQTQQVVYSQSLLDRSKRGGARASLVLASRPSLDNSRSQSSSRGGGRARSPRDIFRRKSASGGTPLGTAGTSSTTPSTSYSSSSRMTQTVSHVGQPVLSGRNKHKSPARLRKETSLAQSLGLSNAALPSNGGLHRPDADEEEDTIVSRAEWE